MVYAAGSYNTSYSIYVPNAYLGAKSYYYWRCFYLCTASDASSAEMTGGASFTVVGGQREHLSDAPISACRSVNGAL